MTIRMPETLHQQLSYRADMEGVSLNQFVVYTLTKEISREWRVEAVPPEEVEAQKKRINALIEKLGSNEEFDMKAFFDSLPEAPKEKQLSEEIEAKFKKMLSNSQ